MSGVDLRWRLTACYEPLGSQHDDYKNSIHTYTSPEFGHVTSVNQRLVRPVFGTSLARQTRNQTRSNRSGF